jgi:hypothetical protein
MHKARVYTGKGRGKEVKIKDFITFAENYYELKSNVVFLVIEQ